MPRPSAEEVALKLTKESNTSEVRRTGDRGHLWKARVVLPTDVLAPDLDDVERSVLCAALNEWRGPARCTDALAVAMGFGGLDDLHAETWRLQQALQDRELLAAADWLRVIVAAEIVFISDVFGSGHDWMFTTGFSDEDALHAIRSVQHKIPGLRVLLGNQ